MAAEYAMKEMRDMRGGGKTILYPRMVIKRCVPLGELLRNTLRYTTFSPAEAEGVVREFVRGLAGALAGGCSVKVDGLGVFTPALGLKKGKEREQPGGTGGRRNASSIEISGANFRPDKEFIRMMNERCTLRRSGKSFSLKTSGYSEAERLAVAKSYLASESRLSVRMYAELVGISATSASRELRRWAEDPVTGITTDGRGTHKKYVLRK